MKRLVFLFVVLAPFLSRATTLTGIAKNRKGDVVYIEKHLIKNDNSGLSQFITVEYSKSDDKIFATMTSDFSKHKLVPDTTFEDKRLNSKSTITVVGESVVFEEFKNNKPVSKKSLTMHESMVASQGFDNFIKLNSSKLAAGPIEFKFGVLEKKDFYSLTGYRKPSSNAELVEYGIRVSSWFVRIFAEELAVSYDAQSMRLKTFSGRSNILDDSGRSQDVVIQYQWSDKP